MGEYVVFQFLGLMSGDAGAGVVFFGLQAILLWSLSAAAILLALRRQT